MAYADGGPAASSRRSGPGGTPGGRPRVGTRPNRARRRAGQGARCGPDAGGAIGVRRDIAGRASTGRCRRARPRRTCGRPGGRPTPRHRAGRPVGRRKRCHGSRWCMDHTEPCRTDTANGTPATLLPRSGGPGRTRSETWPGASPLNGPRSPRRGRWRARSRIPPGVGGSLGCDTAQDPSAGRRCRGSCAAPVRSRRAACRPDTRTRSPPADRSDARFWPCFYGRPEGDN